MVFREDPGGGGGGSVAAIDPQLMAQMNASIQSGADTLVNQGGSLKGRFSREFLDAAPLTEIVNIGRWAQDQLPMLTRRQTLAAAIDDTPGAHFYDEYASGMNLTPAQAAQQGSALAAGDRRRAADELVVVEGADGLLELRAGVGGGGLVLTLAGTGRQRGRERQRQRGGGGAPRDRAEGSHRRLARGGDRLTGGCPGRGGDRRGASAAMAEDQPSAPLSM